MRAWLLRLAPLAVAVILATGLLLTAEGPQRADNPTRRAVTVTTAEPRAVTPTVTSLGLVSGVGSWQATAEQAGDIVAKADAAVSGATVAGGRELLRIDPTPAQTDVDRLAAEGRQLQERASGLDQQIADLERQIAHARQIRSVRARRLDRVETLVAENAAPPTRRDDAEEALASQEERLVQLQSQRRSLRSDRAELAEQQASLAARRRQAEHRLSQTRVTTPHRSQLTSVAVARGDTVQPGQPLVSGVATSASEIRLQLADATLKALTGTPTPPEASNLAASVVGAAGERVTVTPRRFEGRADPATRTATLVLEARHADANDAAAPPLAPETHVTVRLAGPPVRELPVVPRSSVRNGRIITLDADNRLVPRQVTVGPGNADVVTVRAGLSAGTRVLTTPPAGPVAGMPVRPVTPDETP